MTCQLFSPNPRSGSVSSVSMTSPTDWKLLRAVCAYRAAFALGDCPRRDVLPAVAHGVLGLEDRAQSLLVTLAQRSPRTTRKAEPGLGMVVGEGECCTDSSLVRRRGSCISPCIQLSGHPRQATQASRQQRLPSRRVNENNGSVVDCCAHFDERPDERPVSDISTSSGE